MVLVHAALALLPTPLQHRTLATTLKGIIRAADDKTRGEILARTLGASYPQLLPILALMLQQVCSSHSSSVPSLRSLSTYLSIYLYLSLSSFILRIPLLVPQLLTSSACPKSSLPMPTPPRPPGLLEGRLRRISRSRLLFLTIFLTAISLPLLSPSSSTKPHKQTLS